MEAENQRRSRLERASGVGISVEGAKVRSVPQEKLHLAAIVLQCEFDQLRRPNVAHSPRIAGNQALFPEKISAFEILSLRLKICGQHLVDKFGLEINRQVA